MSAEDSVARRKPGPRKGQKHSGQFSVGYDPRRGNTGPSRKSLMEQVAEAAESSAPDAVRYLASVMNDESEHVKMRIIAAREILDRSVGTSVSRQVVHQIRSEGMNGQGGNTLENLLPAREYTDAELLQIINSQNRVNGVSDNETIADGEFIEVTPQVAANKAAN